MMPSRAAASRALVTVATACVGALAWHGAMGQVPAGPVPPSVTVSASATSIVSNDRLQASLRAEAENQSAAAAASQVNATIAKAIAEAKAFAGVRVATAGYSTQQIAEKGKPTRWRVAQSISLDASDFTAAATLMSKLQDENGLLLSGMSFSLAEKTRRDAEDSVTLQAIKSWQARAHQAAQGLGFPNWRVGHVSVEASGPAYPLARAQTMAVASAAPPVALEPGTTEVTVTVSGDAVLETASAPTR